MGRGRRPIPKQMPVKIKLIRQIFNLTIEETVGRIVEQLNSLNYFDIKIYLGHITEFEQGKREPLLPILLAYARLANIYVDVLIDDELELPKQLPIRKKKKEKTRQ